MEEKDLIAIGTAILALAPHSGESPGMRALNAATLFRAILAESHGIDRSAQEDRNRLATRLADVESELTTARAELQAAKATIAQLQAPPPEPPPAEDAKPSPTVAGPRLPKARA